MPSQVSLVTQARHRLFTDPATFAFVIHAVGGAGSTRMSDVNLSMILRSWADSDASRKFRVRDETVIERKRPAPVIRVRAYLRRRKESGWLE